MKIDLNDPRLTAYALGEMDLAEQTAFEKEIGDSEELRREIEAIRETAEMLALELQDEPAPELTPEQRQAIKTGAPKAPPRRRRWLVIASWAAAAACLGVVGGIWAILNEPVYYSLPAGGGSSHEIASRPAADSEKIFQELGQPITRPAPDPKPASGRQRPELSASAETVTRRREIGDRPVIREAVKEAAAKMRRGLKQIERNEESGLLTIRADYRKSPGPQPPPPPPSEPPAAVLALPSNGGPPPLGAVGARLSSREPPPAGKATLAVNGILEPAATATGPAEASREAYNRLVENPFKSPYNEPLSTFSIDVDTASYSNMRRFLNGNSLPPPDSVRIEEYVNYFSYDYPQPKGEDPFSVNVEVAACPWNKDYRLARIGLKGKEIKREKRPDSNLVFLIDVSGSMRSANKLPLVQQGMKLLVDQLGNRDRVALTVYAGAAGMVLDSTPASDKNRIKEAIGKLRSGGSTNGGAGIELAYKLAAKNFIKGGVNRVILCTDGDFNVGVSSQGALTRLVEEKAKTGVFLSVLGFGGGNLNDAMMEEITNKGNGNYAYVDSLDEAKKVLVEQMSGTLVTIAKDVKIQLEFNPMQVAAYRLVGYENRMLAAQDFNDDTKDAGEIGAGHTVTAFYEIVPIGVPVDLPSVDELKYQPPPLSPEQPPEVRHELLTVKLRYKQPDGDVSKLIQQPVIDYGKGYDDASADYRFAAAVAAYGMILRQSKYRASATCDGVLELAGETVGNDPRGYRQEFIELVKKAKARIPKK